MTPPQLKVFTVSQFVSAISLYLEQGIGEVAIQGEVTGFRTSRDQLIFFELKDQQSRMLCFLMKWQLRMPIEDGMEVKVIGAPKLFQKSGGFHLRVSSIELVGQGALQRAFELLKEKLQKEGLFAPERKRPLPRFPEHIGIVTSEDAAAYTDVLRVLTNRWSGLRMTLAHVGVQGAIAIPQIAGAIQWFNAERDDHRPDVLIVTRGGGSLEDLQAFNSEEVARAIFSSRIPVVVGVGHERDVTLADFVADVRAATPSNAAELVVPDRGEVLWQINAFAQAIEQRLHRAIGERRHETFLALQQMYDRVRATIDAPEELLRRFVQGFQNFRASLATLKERLASRVQLLHAFSPEATLARGYSMTFVDGRIVKSVRDVESGETMTTRLKDGSIESIVE